MHKKSIFIMLAICYVGYAKILKNNVCKRWKDYNNMETNPNCWHNPDVDSPVEDIVARRGFLAKKYDVHTNDGYILNLFRIIKKDSDPQDKQPIYLQHGMATDCRFWISVSNRSLALHLVEENYDVWLGNVRGNRYGRKHVNLTVGNRKFWDYSIDDIAMNDVPAQLAVVAKENKSGSKIVYVGHSMGTTLAFMYAIDRKEEAERNLEMLILLSPAVYFKNLVYLRNIVALLYPVSVDLEKMYSELHLNMILASDQFREFLMNFCTRSHEQIETCFYISQLLFGRDKGQFLPEDFPIILSYGSSGVSFKCVTHYIQMSGSKKFQHYDFGIPNNQKVYGSPSPPVYNLSEVAMSVHLFNGINDALTTHRDVQSLYHDLKTKKSLTVFSEGEKYRFNHVDFIVAKDVERVFIKPFMNFLNQELFNNKIK